MHPAIDACLRATTVVAETPALADWLPNWQRGLAAGGPPIVLALRGGFAADRLAWAFAAGYQAALRTLLPGVGPHELLSLCLTETTGKRPRELRCTVTQQADGCWLLEGHKSWAAFGASCTTMLVIARSGDGAGAAGAGSDATPQPQLLALRVPHDVPGVHLDGMPATGLIPELPHGRLELQQVLLPAHACLPGDGYSDFAKPFATLEDLNVGAAVLAYVLREARARSWPSALRERLVATLALLVSLAEEPLAAAATQLALAGALDWARQTHTEAAALFAATPDDPAAQRWQRDAKLLGVLDSARAQRAARAWEQLAGPA
jgi:alkylation response protein AidB-like acyl-CoA dehydrogenase